MKKEYAIIVAGGTGHRMKSEIPKQFLLLNGRPMLMYSIAAFHDYSPEIEIIVVLPDGKSDYWQKLCEKHQFKLHHKTVTGGKTRFESVRKGLELVDESGYVAIHDGARPVVSAGLIKSCFDTAKEQGNALPVIEISDSIRVVDQESSKPLERTNIRICQTPQVFLCSEIIKAYKQSYRIEFTDDATVLESAGYSVFLTHGQPQNIKVTSDTDLLIAENLLKNCNKS